MLGVEKKSILQLQDPRTVRKVVMLDDHVCLAFAGIASTLLFDCGVSLIYFERFNSRWQSPYR